MSSNLSLRTEFNRGRTKMSIMKEKKDLLWPLSPPKEAQTSTEDDVEVVFENNASSKDEVQLVLEVKKYSTKDSLKDSHKITLLENIGSFLGLTCTQIFNDDCILVGDSLLSWLHEWFPDHDEDFLKGVSESQAVRNCQASLTDLYNSISIGALGDDTISTEAEDLEDLEVGTTAVTYANLDAILSGRGITSRFPYIRCRLTPDSLVSEQQRQHTFEKANLSDMLLDNLYRYAENFYLKRYHIRTYCGASCKCFHAPLSDTHSIERIDFIVHPKLIKEYDVQKENFQNEKIDINEKLLFHGTHATNVNKILADNFKLDVDPVSRKKLNMYGQGIYFSDFPAQSLKYGEALLLCKVLLGKEEVIQLGCKPTTNEEYFQKNYNSRKMVDRIDRKDVPAKIYMVPKSHQILPCYIIYLKKKEGSAMNSSAQTNISGINLPQSALRRKGKQLLKTVLGNLSTLPSSNQPGINDSNKNNVSVPTSSSRTQQTQLNITRSFSYIGLFLHISSKNLMKSGEKLIPIDPHFEQIKMELKDAIENGVRAHSLSPYNKILALCIQVSRLECITFNTVKYNCEYIIFPYFCTINRMFYYCFI